MWNNTIISDTSFDERTLSVYTTYSHFIVGRNLQSYNQTKYNRELNKNRILRKGK